MGGGLGLRLADRRRLRTMRGRQVGSLWWRNKSQCRKCGARWHRQRRELKPQSEHPSGVSPGSRQLLAATGKFAGSFAGVAAGMAASVAAGEGSWLDTARSLLPSLSRGYKLLTPLARGSPLCKTLPPSSTISKASLEILPRQQRSASLSTRSRRVCYRICWILSLATIVGVNNMSCLQHLPACLPNLPYLPTCRPTHTRMMGIGNQKHLGKYAYPIPTFRH